MGFGFVEYRKPEQAQKALKQLQVTGLSGEVRVTGRRRGGSRQPSMLSGSAGLPTLAPALRETVAQEQPRAFLGVRSRCGAFIHPQLVIQGPGVLTTQLSFPSQASSLVTGTACGHHWARGTGPVQLFQ